jgi:hypothetical protein
MQENKLNDNLESYRAWEKQREEADFCKFLQEFIEIS